MRHAGRSQAGPDSDPWEVWALFAVMTDRLAAVLSQPVVAIVAGVLVGAVLLIASRRSFGRLNAGSPERGLVFAAVSLLARLAAAVALLALSRRFAPAGLPYFGLSLAGTFLALHMVELVRFAGLWRYSRPVRARG